MGEQVHVMCSSPVLNMIDGWRGSKTFIQDSIENTGRTIHVLSKGIILELILAFKNIGLINFCGFIDPRKIFKQEKFPDYGTFLSNCTIAVGMILLSLLLLILYFKQC